MELSASKSLTLIFDDRSPCDFWYMSQKKYKELCDGAVRKKISFPSTYFCEQSFSAFTFLNGKIYIHKINIKPHLS